VCVGSAVIGQQEVGFTTSQFPLTRPEPGAWPRREWPKNIGQPPRWFAVDSALEAYKLLLAKDDAIRIEAGAEPSPAEQVRLRKADMNTGILATVQTGGWVTGWTVGFISLVAVSIRECRLLVLLAFKGGPACDEELVLMEWVLDQFGFKKTKVADTTSVFVDKWELNREGIAKISINRYTYRAPEDALIEERVLPLEGHGLAPNLIRIALVSAPSGAVPGINQQLSGQLDRAIERAEKKGWAPWLPWDHSQEANAAHRSYMDMGPLSLAAQGVAATGRSSRFE